MESWVMFFCCNAKVYVADIAKFRLETWAKE